MCLMKSHLVETGSGVAFTLKDSKCGDFSGDFASVTCLSRTTPMKMLSGQIQTAVSSAPDHKLWIQKSTTEKERQRKEKARENMQERSNHYFTQPKAHERLL